MRHLISGVLLLVTLAAGCTSPSDEDAPDTADPSSLPPSSPGETATGTNTSAPKAFEILHTLPNTTDDGLPWSLVAVLDEDQLLVDIESSDGHRAAFFRPSTGKEEYLSEAATGAIFAADSDENHIAWITSTADDLFTLPWELWIYDRSTRESMLLTAAPDVGVSPTPAAPDGTYPSLAAGRVYYTAVQSVKTDGTVVPAVYSVATSGGAVRVEEPGVFDGTAVGNSLFYVRAASFYDWELVTRPLQGGGEKVVAEGGSESRFSGVAVAEDGTVATQDLVNNRCTVRKWSRSAGSSTIAEGGCSKRFAYYLEATSDFISFGYIHDRGGYAPQIVTEDGAISPSSDELTARSIVGHGSIFAWTSTAKQPMTTIGRLL